MWFYFKEKNLKTMSINFLTKLTLRKGGSGLDILPVGLFALQRETKFGQKVEKDCMYNGSNFYFFEIL